MHAAWADDAPAAQDTKKVERIEVIGTNIKRIKAESASPVQIIKREDIEKSGSTTVSELLNSLSLAQDINGAANVLNDVLNGSGTFSPGASSVSLRSLGEGSTLVLMNGRRVPSFGLANFQDLLTNLDALPLSAIDRIEVLKSGASAIYGSEAVAGVINIVTRKDYQGLEVSARHEQSITTGKFGSSEASITGGMGDLDKDRYNVLVNFDAYHRDSTMWTDLLGYVNKDIPKYYPLFGSLSTLSPIGNYFDFNTGASSPGTPCNAPLVLSHGACRYPRYNDIQAVPQSDRYNLLASGQYQVNDRMTAYGEVDYSHLKTTYINQHSSFDSSNGLGFWINPSNHQLQTFYQPFLSGSSPINPFANQGDDAELRIRFTDSPDNINVDASQYRILGGLKGSSGAYDWDTAIGLMGSHAQMKQRGMSASGFIKEIGDFRTAQVDSQGATVISDPNYFNQPGGYKIGGPNSAAVLNTLFPEDSYTGDMKHTFVDGKISGPLTDWYAGTINFATGAELHNERYTLTPSANLQQGDIIQNGISTADSSRTFGAVFGELSIPLAKKLEAQVAARVDKYPNFAAHISPKLGVRWEATDSLLLRGTVETGFRAPNLLEADKSEKFAYISNISDPARCAAATQLGQDLLNFANSVFNNPNATPQQIAVANGAFTRSQLVPGQECGQSIAQNVLNNPNLKPETSRSFSLGGVFEPFKGFSTSLDYFNIKRKDQINLLGVQQILNGNVPAGVTVNRAATGTADPTFQANDPQLGVNDFVQYGLATQQGSSVIYKPNLGPVTYVQEKFQNLGTQQTSGVDINVKSKWNTSYGKIDVDLNATYNLTFKDDQVDPTSANLIGKYGYPRFVTNITTTLSKGAFTEAVRFNYKSGTSLDQAPGDGFDAAGCTQKGWGPDQCRVNGYLTTDFFFEYTGVKNLTASLDVRNIFDKKYPTDLRAVYNSSGEVPFYLQDAEGRMAQVKLTYKFF